jgi:hypothetical protein
MLSVKELCLYSAQSLRAHVGQAWMHQVETKYVLNAQVSVTMRLRAACASLVITTFIMIRYV